MVAAYLALPTALVAGHSPFDARIVRDALVRLGVGKVESVLDGTAALAALKSNPPDLLVVDWDLPAMPVDNLVAAARERGEGGPRIVLTMAAPTRRAVEEAKAMGVDSIVVAPFSPRALMDRVPRLRRTEGAVPSAGAGQAP